MMAYHTGDSLMDQCSFRLYRCDKSRTNRGAMCATAFSQGDPPVQTQGLMWNTLLTCVFHHGAAALLNGTSKRA